MSTRDEARLREVAETLAMAAGFERCGCRDGANCRTTSRHDAFVERVERVLRAERMATLRTAAAVAKSTDEGWDRESYAADEIHALAEREAGHE